MSELLKDYPAVVEIPVRWGDMDAMQHVNNTLFFRYFESARIAYFEKIDIFKDMKKLGKSVILASTSCTFKAPLKYPDTVFAGAKVIEMKEHSFTIKHSLVSKKLNKEVAEGEAVMVYYDYKEKKKLIISDELRNNILKIEKKELS
jgi:acyl-CoA thioester hydrolase